MPNMTDLPDKLKTRLRFCGNGGSDTRIVMQYRIGNWLGELVWKVVGYKAILQPLEVDSQGYAVEYSFVGESSNNSAYERHVLNGIVRSLYDECSHYLLKTQWEQCINRLADPLTVQRMTLWFSALVESRAAEDTDNILSACNLQAVVNSFHELTQALAVIGYDTDGIRAHPAVAIYADRCNEMAGGTSDFNRMLDKIGEMRERKTNYLNVLINELAVHEREDAAQYPEPED